MGTDRIQNVCTYRNLIQLPSSEPISTRVFFNHELCGFNSDLLSMLLSDKTTKQNIIWGTNDYLLYGKEYDEHFPITIDLISGNHSNIIQPRILKARHEQTSRKKDKAEVFTPAWNCNNQINLIDNAWFGIENVFNIPQYGGWKTNMAPITFSSQKGHRWQDYVDLKRIEITCGEAPYITSRYDMASGKPIPVPERIGILDRKLRVVGENTCTLEDWTKWALRALESTYGFEFQGDNLLIARENTLFTFAEHMNYKFGHMPEFKILKKAANIIIWNIWQMDGLTYTVPYVKVSQQYHQISMFDSQEKPIYCKIHDWRSKKTLLYKSIVEER